MFQHLQEVNQTYVQHMFFSLNFSSLFLMSSIKAFVHSFIPSLFTTSTTDCSEFLQEALHDRSYLQCPEPIKCKNI